MLGQDCKVLLFLQRSLAWDLGPDRVHAAEWAGVRVLSSCRYANPWIRQATLLTRHVPVSLVMGNRSIPLSWLWKTWQASARCWGSLCRSSAYPPGWPVVV